MTSVRIGVIGCGRIAQVMHLPFLDELPQFELVALSDLSADVLSGLGRRYRAESTTDYTELLERVDIEAVAITTPDHAAIAEQAARAGKHVFVEKPLCFTPAEGQRIADAVHDAGVRLMVGYMRRFDPAVMRLHELLPEIGQIRVVRARDMLGLRSVPTDIYTMTMPTEGSAGSVSNRAPFQSRLAEGVGSDDPRRVNLYWVMLMLGIHHLAVLRALLGEPAEVQGTELLGEQHLVTTLLYEDGERALLELGVWPMQTWTETSLDVVTDTSVVSLSFPNPWVRYLPTTLVRRSAEDDGTVETHHPDSYRSAFREEWLAFHELIVGSRELGTPVAQGLADIELAAAIVSAIPERQLDRLVVPPVSGSEAA